MNSCVHGCVKVTSSSFVCFILNSFIYHWTESILFLDNMAWVNVLGLNRICTILTVTIELQKEEFCNENLNIIRNMRNA